MLLLLGFILVFNFGTIIGRECDDCVKYTACNEARNLLKALRNEKTAELVRSAFCGYDNNGKRPMPKVCCSDFYNVMLIKHPNFDFLPKGCGNINGNRIIGGTYPTLYELPWMTLISYRVEGGVMFRCAGSIINSFHILTAAHCVQNKRLAGVRVGDFDYRKRDDCQVIIGKLVCESHVQDILIEETIIHPNYSTSGTWTNDIALLRLAKEIHLNHSNVAPICLPITEELRKENITGMEALVAGWGITENHRESSTLLKVDMPILSDDDCKRRYNRKLLPDENNRVENKICAGARGKDSCGGDSGGPLIVEKEYYGKYSNVQYGIVSQGPTQCGSDMPGLYTDVTKYLTWILDNVTK